MESDISKSVAPSKGLAFHQFSKLPWELQMMVWVRARHPRLLHLKYMQKRGILTLHAKKNITFVPPLLHVCKDSREEALKHYQLLVLNPTAAVQSRVYVDFGRDVVYFNCRFNRCLGQEQPWGGDTPHVPFRDWDKQAGTNVHLIKFAAFDCRFYQGLTGNTMVPRGLIKHFENLREFIFVPIVEKQRHHDLLDWPGADRYGFENLPIHDIINQSKKNNSLYAKLHKFIRYFNWNLLETRTYDPPGDWLEEDLADPRYKGSRPGYDIRGEYYPASGFIEDPFLKSNELIFKNTNMRIVRDLNIFAPDNLCVARQLAYKREYELQQIQPNNLLIRIPREEMQNIRAELATLKTFNLDREEDLMQNNPRSLQLRDEEKKRRELAEAVEEPLQLNNQRQRRRALLTQAPRPRRAHGANQAQLHPSSLPPGAGVFAVPAPGQDTDDDQSAAHVFYQLPKSGDFDDRNDRINDDHY